MAMGQTQYPGFLNQAQQERAAYNADAHLGGTAPGQPSMAYLERVVEELQATVKHLDDRTQALQVRSADKDPSAPQRITPTLSPYLSRLAMCIAGVEDAARNVGMIASRIDVGP